MPPRRDSQNVEQIQQLLQDKLGSRRYQQWFGAKTTLELDGHELSVHVTSPYLIKFIQKQYHQLLLQILSSFVGPAATINYDVGTQVELTPIPGDVAGDVIAKPSLPRTTRKSKNAVSKRTMRLSDIVVGESNELAVTAAYQVVNTPGTISPLYIHGNVGNGKSHLLEGIRLQIRKDQPHLQVMVITAEQFANYFTQALGARTLPSFRNRFRNVDVLLVDDIDFLDGKKGIEEEFLHTVKQFESDQRQLVVTANRHPQLLGKMSQELISRMQSGLVCRLETPDLEMRLDIVSRYAKRIGAELGDATTQYIAKHFQSNARELEGAINLLSTWSKMSRKKVTVTVARKLLNRLERDCMKIVRMGDVENAVCELFGVNQEELKSDSRKRTLSEPRMLAMYLARRLTQAPYSEIGEYFGGRNHSTVMSAEKKILARLQEQNTIRLASENWSMEDIVHTLEDRIKAG